MNFLPWILKFIIGFTFFIIPLFRSESFLFFSTTGKTLLFYFLVQIIFFLWLIIAVGNNQYRPKKSLLLFSVSALVLTYTISGFFGYNNHLSFWSSLERMTGLLTIYHVSAFFIVIISTIKNKKDWNFLFFIHILTGVIALFIGYFQFYVLKISNGIDNLESTFGNSSILASYLIFCVFISIYLIYEYRKSKIAYIPAVILSIIVTSKIFLNLDNFQSLDLNLLGTARAASVGVFVGLMMVSINYLIKNVKIRKLFNYTSLVGLILFFVVMSYPGTFLFEKAKVFGFGNRDIFWTNSIEGIRERPILGWGPENFSNLMHFKTSDIDYESDRKSEIGASKPHNVFLEILFSGGMISFLIYLFIILYIYSLLVRKRKLIPFVGLFFAININNLFLFDTLTSYISYVLIISFILFDYLKINKDEKSLKKDLVIEHEYAGVIIFFFLIVFYFFSYQPYKQQSLIIDSVSPDEFDYVDLMSMRPWRETTNTFLMKSMIKDYSVLGEQDWFMKRLLSVKEGASKYLELYDDNYEYLLYYYYLTFIETQYKQDLNLLDELDKYDEKLKYLSPQSRDAINVLNQKNKYNDRRVKDN